MFKIAATLTLSIPLLLGLTAQNSPDDVSVNSTLTSEADKELKALRQKFTNLNKSLLALGGISDASHKFIENLREQFASFNNKHPGNRAGIANELQLAMWLDDNKIIDSLYPKLIDVADERQPLRTAWATIHKKKNNYMLAIDILEAEPYDPEKDPRAALLYSDCLFAENRFQEAVDVLDAIPSGATLGTPLLMVLGTQISRILSERESTLQFWVKEEEIRSTELFADDLPRVELITDKGRIVVELFENEAPNTVANFITLVESGFYDLSKFHRVIPDFMAQGGDPNTKPGGTGDPGKGNPGYRIPDEHIKSNARNHFAGSLSMAKDTPPDTGGCQFFLTHRPTIDLNGKHTVFGRILEGLDVARSLEVDDVLQSAKVLRKRDHEYLFKTLDIPTPSSSSGSSLGLPLNIDK